MIVNLHSIRLDPCNGRHEEYPLLPTETGSVLPGAIVAVTNATSTWTVYDGVGETAQSNGTLQSETDPPTNDPGKILVPASGTPGSDDYVAPHYVISRSYVTSQAPTNAIANNAVELLIVTEDSYGYGNINHKYTPGEVVYMYRAVSGDRYLIRAVAGSYVEGDAVYLTQTTNGIYVTKTAPSATARPIGYAGESYVVYSSDKTDVNPKFYYDAIDDSTPIRPSSRWLNGAVFNLLKVRIA